MTPLRPIAKLSVALAVFGAACGAGTERIQVPTAGVPGGPPVRTQPPASLSESDAPAVESTPTVAEASTTRPTTTTTSTTTTTTSTTTTVPAPSTLPLPAPPERPLANPFFGESNDAFDRLAAANAAASMTIARGGEIVFTRASGRTIDDLEASGDSPMVVASVSKIIVAVGVARLHDAGLVDVAAPVPWADLGLTPDPAWGDVTVRELLDHTSGLTKSRFSWFTGEGTCRDYVPNLLTSPPLAHRGQWVYSNGNYCLLGLLIEHRSGLPLDQALQQLVFDPVGADGVHLTSGGLQPGDVVHPEGVDRLSRLGGAGTLIVSTDDTAVALGRLTAADLAILQPPGVFTDQYGWGHTGTVDGAKACIWVFDGGDTVVSATIAGNSVGTGGGVCDIVVPAVAVDLGFGGERPVRTP